LHAWASPQALLNGSPHGELQPVSSSHITHSSKASRQIILRVFEHKERRPGCFPVEFAVRWTVHRQMDMTVNQARQNGVPAKIESGHGLIGLPLRSVPDGINPPISKHQERIFQRRTACPVNERHMFQSDRKWHDYFLLVSLGYPPAKKKQVLQAYYTCSLLDKRWLVHACEGFCQN
jgi:hypothetical protein